MIAAGRLEWAADAIVHLVGIALAAAACATLAIVALPDADGLHVASLSLYASGLVAMLACSALYNVLAGHRWNKAFKRLDHAAIFLMIAGTYTPFTLLVMGNATGIALCVFVWAVALSGAAVQIAAPARLRRFGVAAYLLLGWSGAATTGTLVKVMSAPGLILLGTGGVLYSIGVIFYLSRRLVCHLAIWHGFVLAAAACHFSALMTDVVAAEPRRPAVVGAYEPMAAFTSASASLEPHSAPPASVPISQPLPSMRREVGSPTSLPACWSV